MQKVTIIGAAGYVGQHLSDAQELNFVPSTKISRYADNPFHAIAMSETDRLVSVIPPDASVYLLAWDSSPASAGALGDVAVDRNVVEHIALIDRLASRGVGRIVFVSSGGTVYGEPHVLPIPERHPLLPINAYGAAKKMVENYLVAAGDRYGFDYCIARLSNLYGGGQVVKKNQGLVAAIRGSVIHDTPLAIWGDGSVVRDYLHIDDAVAALIMCGTHANARQKIFNVGTGQGTSIVEMIALVEKKLGRKINVSYQTRHAVDVSKNILDVSKINTDLQWSPSVTLDTGLAEIFSPLKAV